jgi:hypothetical protein
MVEGKRCQGAHMPTHSCWVEIKTLGTKYQTIVTT